jgi:hypothetical protein
MDTYNDPYDSYFSSRRNYFWTYTIK